MGQAEQEFPWLARQLSWDERSDSVFSHLSSEESHGSSESLNDQIEEVTSDLKDMLREVEVLKVSFCFTRLIHTQWFNVEVLCHPRQYKGLDRNDRGRW